MKICVCTDVTKDPECPSHGMNAQVNDPVNHPLHYGGADNPYEAIKVIEAWTLGFCLGNAVKYISRANKKGTPTQDIRKAIWYLERALENGEVHDQF